MRRTQQEPAHLHEIWEGQLVELLSLRRDGLSDAMAIAIGVATGLIPTCWESIAGYFSAENPVPLTKLHLAEIVIFGVSLGVAAVAFIINKIRGARSLNLATIIRGQIIE
jgi:hypothetical protein